MTSPAPEIPCFAAVDLSGPDDRDPFTSCAALVGIRPQMEAFDRAWLILLGRYGLPYLRMADAVRWRGPFKLKAAEWKEKREQIRDEVLFQAAWLVRTSLQPHTTSHDTTKLQPKVRRPRYAKQLLFQTMVRQLINRLPESFVLHFYCDDDQEVAPEFYRGINQFKKVDKAYARRIASVCFNDDTRLPVLQAADMVAYVERDRRAGRPNPLGPLLWKDPEHEDVIHPFTPPPEGGPRPQES